MITVNVRTDFSEDTGLRYCSKSDNSGEAFYHDILNQKFVEAYQTNDKLQVVFDAQEDGYSPSFVDEAIGNLVYDFTLDVVKVHLIIQCGSEPQINYQIEKSTFPKWEEKRNRKRGRIITERHDDWYALVNGDLLQTNEDITNV